MKKLMAKIKASPWLLLAVGIGIYLLVYFLRKLFTKMRQSKVDNDLSKLSEELNAQLDVNGIGEVHNFDLDARYIYAKIHNKVEIWGVGTVTLPIWANGDEDDEAIIGRLKTYSRLSYPALSKMYRNAYGADLTNELKEALSTTQMARLDHLFG